MLFLSLGTWLYFNHPDSDASHEREIKQLQNKLNQYEANELKVKLEEEKIKAMIDPQIIIDKLESVGQLITYKGNVTYSNHIAESKFYGSRSITYKFRYEFGIGMDLSHIKVKQVYDETVILSIPKSELKLIYIELKEDLMKSENTWFTSSFDPGVVNVLTRQAKESVTDDVLNNRKVFDDGLDSLKSNVEGLMKQLGFEEVIFEEV